MTLEGTLLLRRLVFGAFVIAGLTLFIAGPIASIANDWDVYEAVTISATGAISLVIAYVMKRTRQV